MRRQDWTGARASTTCGLVLPPMISPGHAQQRAPSVVITQVDRSGLELRDSQPLECQGSHCFGVVSLDIRGSTRKVRAVATLEPGQTRVAVEAISDRKSVVEGKR